MPQPPRTDRRAIVAATIGLLDEVGLEKVSLHAIAARLGVKQPALYHHFDSKAALMAAVADEVLDRYHTDRLPDAGEAWDAFVIRNARSLRRAMLSVRDGARLISSAGSRVPEQGNAIAKVDLLERAGFDGRTAVLALIAVSRYTIGAALEEQASRSNPSLADSADGLEGTDDRAARFGRTLRAAAAAGADGEFELGLTALVRGLDDSRENDCTGHDGKEKREGNAP
ncbi:TetR/AcrR family transcriptional regulator C-terminal domain-containing protein [uncultured Leifsonia sp.]|uniref:TetR/AcrR family transcriptional regulator C-terminal domain-containing protein n=1 Tax=uncultured Leifsonia sp. TaxID=340359 RepID=UPI0028D0A07F|nr:TetR/AcrR family transcriptional regulator C-terminal domain-containing protein [uncultured Leifsonia sp.]